MWMEIVFYIILSLVAVFYMLRLFNIKSKKADKKDCVHSEKLDKFLTKNFKYLWLLSIIGIVLYLINYHKWILI